MAPGHFGSLAAVVTLDRPASSAVKREVLGWEPVQPGTIADLDNGNYFLADSAGLTADLASRCSGGELRGKVIQRQGTE